MPECQKSFRLALNSQTSRALRSHGSVVWICVSVPGLAVLMTGNIFTAQPLSAALNVFFFFNPCNANGHFR